MTSEGYTVLRKSREIKLYFKEYKREVNFLNDSEDHKEYLLSNKENFKEWLEDTYDLTLEDY